MPLTLPPFVQYQSPMFPLRGLWNNSPPEGDKFVNVEIDWLLSPPGNAVQFQLAGNSPVAISQIVSLVVDNSRCGADVDYVFPDSGFVLTAPARSQGVYPVFTNALMFYAVASKAVSGDITVFQILNSMPPPIPIQLSQQTSAASVANITLNNGTYPLLAAGVNGTIQSVSLGIEINSQATQQGCNVELTDGTGKLLWLTAASAAANAAFSQQYQIAGPIRFINGLNLVVLNSTANGLCNVNVYYSQP